jgi:hypothetical protein
MRTKKCGADLNLKMMIIKHRLLLSKANSQLSGIYQNFILRKLFALLLKISVVQ